MVDTAAALAETDEQAVLDNKLPDYAYMASQARVTKRRGPEPIVSLPADCQGYACQIRMALADFAAMCSSSRGCREAVAVQQAGNEALPDKISAAFGQQQTSNP